MKFGHLIVVAFIMLSLCAFSAVTVDAEAPKVSASKKELTREEKVSEIKKRLADSEELFNMLPGLKTARDADGKASFTFNGVNIESLSDEDIGSLLIRIRQRLARMRTERIERQLKAAEKIENILKAPAAPPSPARIPSVAPSVPKAPPSPSSASQRR